MKKLMILLVVVLSGCTTLSSDVQLVTEGKETAELKVFRESAFQNGAVSLYVGENDKYFLKLWSGGQGSVKIDAGPHIFQAKADASPASTIEVTLKPNETTCLKGTPNEAALGAIVIPIVANMVPSFVLTEIDCPPEHTKNENESINNS